MRCALFVTHQDVTDLVLLENLIVDRQHRPARIAKDVLDTLIGQRRQNDLCTCHLLSVLFTHRFNPHVFRSLHKGS